jgi:hypothetical protein
VLLRNQKRNFLRMAAIKQMCKFHTIAGENSVPMGSEWARESELDAQGRK